MFLLYFYSNFIYFFPETSIVKKSVLVQVMAWHLTGNKSFPEPLFTETSYITRPHQIIPITISAYVAHLSNSSAYALVLTGDWTSGDSV